MFSCGLKVFDRFLSISLAFTELRSAIMILPTVMVLLY